MPSDSLTGPQRLMLEALAQVVDGQSYSTTFATPRQLAKIRWPDSPAWEKRTRRYGTGHNGAVGGTMPMKAATVLHRLLDMGLVYRGGELENEWRLTRLGAEVASGATPTIPKSTRVADVSQSQVKRSKKPRRELPGATTVPSPATNHDTSRSDS